MKENIIIYLKGFLMGICDLIPGISGGTIAFITGIYERLISSIEKITSYKYFVGALSSLKDKKKIKNIFNELDIFFLIVLFGGIFSAIIIGSNFISYLLENYLIILLSFFIGLIFSSSLFIKKQIINHSKENYLFAAMGFLLGGVMFFLVPQEISGPSFFYVFIGGFLAVFALFLPGISGSFILLILGLYEYIINSIKNLSTNYSDLFPFAIGSILGIFVISRLITYLFKQDKCKTLYTLFGLVLGTLLIPINMIFQNIEVITIFLIIKLLILFLLGMYIVYVIEKLNN